MIRSFRSGYPVQFLTIGLIALIIWGISAANPVDMPGEQLSAPLYNLIYDWLHNLPYLCLALGFLLIITEAVWLNIILNQHSLIPSNSSLAALIFVLTISLIPDSHTLNPVNISIVFLLLILQSLLRAYNETEPVEAVYAAGFFTAVGSFFYMPVMLFYLFILLSFIIYRSFSWREWISSLLGFLTPFFYLAVIWFLLDDREKISLSFLQPLLHPIWPVMHLNLATWISFGLLLLLTINGLRTIILRLPDKTVEIRKKTLVVIWMFATGIITIVYAGQIPSFHVGLLAAAIAVFLTDFLLLANKRLWGDIFLWLLLISVLSSSVVHIVNS